MKTRLAWPGLIQDFSVSVRALELAGGYRGILDLFGARLTSFLAPHDYGVVWGGQIIGAFADPQNAEPPFLILGIGGYQAGDTLAPAVLEGVDDYSIAWKASLLPHDEAFAMLFARVRDLIADWPEISAAT